MDNRNVKDVLFDSIESSSACALNLTLPGCIGSFEEKARLGCLKKSAIENKAKKRLLGVTLHKNLS